MSRHGKHIHTGFIDIDGKFANRLNGIGMKNNASAFDFQGNFFKRENNTGFVIGPHDTDNSGVFAQIIIEVIQVETPLAVYRYKRNPIALF